MMQDQKSRNEIANRIGLSGLFSCFPYRLSTGVVHRNLLRSASAGPRAMSSTNGERKQAKWSLPASELSTIQ